MRFWKYHGLGNDFVVVRGAPERFAGVAQALCDRHFGIGADGVLVVSPDERAAARMTVFNADGSRPEMCGNGVRCVARFLVDQGAPEAFQIATDAGLMACRVGDQIAVEVARPTVVGELAVEVGGRLVTGLQVDAGNPHLVLFDVEAEPARDGAALQSALASGVNVSFARIRARDAVDLVVYERGCGLTLACGTAAYSTVTAGWARDLFDATVQVNLPGGTLTVSEASETEITQRGPAERVFTGEWPE